MDIKNETLLSRTTLAFMVINFIVPVFVVKDIDRLPNNIVFLVFLLWIAFNYVIPILLPKILLNMFVSSDDNDDKSSLSIIIDLIGLSYLLTVFMCSIFYYVLIIIPKTG